jgi:molecular chaperone GrpE
MLEDTDKAIEIIKAAMEKEKMMKEKSKESMEKQIDEGSKASMDEQIDGKAEKEAMKKEVQEDQASDEDLENEILNDGNELETSGEENLDADAKPEKTGKSFFKSSKTKELEVKDQKIAELTDRLMRSMAEFDNFRKRSEKEKSAMFDMGVKSIIEKILPIVDNFERGFGTITEKEKETAFAQGIELIYKQLVTALDEIGLKPIDAVGKEFDPNLHNAVMHGDDESLGENIVSDEFQKGYMYRDMVVRHSMVKVVN